MSWRDGRRSRRLLRWLGLYLPGGAIALFLGAWLGSMYGAQNFHEVVPDRVYRSRQPSAENIRHWHEVHHIRTVINLRGPQGRDISPWWGDEVDVCHELGIRLVQPHLKESRLPSRPDLLKLLDALTDESAYPVLIHCRAGADRTGLASAIALILHGGDLAQSVDQGLDWWYGHVPSFSGHDEMGDFFDLYQRYLDQRQIAHSRKEFLHWAREVYAPYGTRAELRLLEQPPRAIVGQPIPITVRATNLSDQAWNLPADGRDGLVLWAGVYTSLPGPWPQYTFPHRAGKVVQPGESVEFNIQLRGFPEPGRYRFKLDLHHPGRHDNFERYGVQPIETSIRILPSGGET
jgi:undecaprenyl-diphosphatase